MLISTFPTLDEAKKIVKILLTERLIACANIIPNIQSLYWWKNEIQEDLEVIVLMKTKTELEMSVINRIKSLHSYEIPAIYAVESMTTIHLPYLEWIYNETKGS